MAIYKLASEVTQHHFHHILLVEASQANLNSREGYIYPTSQWTGCQRTCGHVLFFIEIYLTYNIILVLWVQHNDSIFVYIEKWSSQSITIHSYIFLLVMSTFKIYSLSNFQIYNTVLLTIVTNAVHYIPMTYLFYNWKFVSFDHFTHFAHQHPPPLATTNLFCSLYLWVLFLCVFFFFRFHI